MSKIFSKIKSVVKLIIPQFIIDTVLSPWGGIGEFEFDEELNARKDIVEKYGFNGDLVDLFCKNQGLVVHKWHHYIQYYDRYFSQYRGKKLKFLEIGVSQGGSLQMWRHYFGEDAIIYGVDIDPACAAFNGQSGQVRIGSQIDHEFLDTVVKEMGGIDIVLDDGSHHMNHVSVTFKHLFPLLNFGGVYFVEDMHTAYWRSAGGGYRTKKNFFRFVGDVIDDMHHWYHKRSLRHGHVGDYCSGIHIHDSIVVFEKNKVFRPVHSKHPQSVLQRNEHGRDEGNVV